MTTTKHFAITPNGTKITRTSKSRVYSHVVVARHSHAFDLKCAENHNTQRNMASNFKFYADFVNGTSKFLVKPEWRSEEDHAAEMADRIQAAKDHLDGATTVEEYSASQTAKALARVAAKLAEGYYDKFGALGWSSRLDLAQKVASQSDKPYYEDVTILEAHTF